MFSKFKNNRHLNNNKANKINIKQSETTEKSLNTLENIRVENVTFIHFKLNL